MKDPWKALLVLFVLTPPLIAPASLAEAAQPRFVVCSYGRPASACVHDGDTFWFQGEKIRLFGIDAPEMGQPRCDRPALRAVAARDALIALLNAGSLVLERHGQDRYGRTLARPLVNGADAGAALVKRGLARVYVPGESPWC